MMIVRLDLAEIGALADDFARMAASGGSVLVAIDGPPQEAAHCLKVKLNGGIWSPPMGTQWTQYRHD